MYDAVFIAVGAGLPVFMDVPGENLKGVYSANEYLTRVNLMGALPRSRTRRSCTDSASRSSAAATSPWTRCARRAGWAPPRRSIVYRRGHDELPARAEEVHHAEQEGVRFELLAAPARGPRRRGRLGPRPPLRPHGAGRARRIRAARPEPVPGSEFEIPCDMVVVAIGTRANPLLTASAPDLESTSGATSSSTRTA